MAIMMCNVCFIYVSAVVLYSDLEPASTSKPNGMPMLMPRSWLDMPPLLCTCPSEAATCRLSAASLQIMGSAILLSGGKVANYIL